MYLNAIDLPQEDTNLVQENTNLVQENTNLMPKNANLMQENTNECSSSSTKQHLMVCPICDKKFDVDAISAHADQCASRHEMPHTINCIDPFFDEVEEEEDEAHDVVSGFNTVTQSSLFNILSTVIPPNDESNDETALRLEVRRVHVFDDFKNYFDRKWNIKKKIKDCKSLSLENLGWTLEV